MLSPLGASPYILSLSIPDVLGEAVVLELDRAGYSISSGAACSSHSTEPSHVLTSLELEPEEVRGAIRVSFGKINSIDSTVSLARNLLRTAVTLRKLA